MLMLRALPTLLLCVALTAPNLLAQGSVHVIDASLGAGADFADIQSGIDAASPGDVLLVRTGNYEGFDIEGKPLSIVADEGAAVNINGTALIRNLGANSSVLLAGLQLSTTIPFPLGLFDLRTNVGPLWIEGCTAEGAGMFQVAQVEFLRCTFNSTFGISGISSFSSSVALLESSIVAGNGADGKIDPKLLVPLPGVPGTGGYRATGDDHLHVSGTTIQAGNGGHGLEPGADPCSNGGAGGSGLEILDVDARVFTQASSFHKGLPGQGGAGCNPGARGDDVTLIASATPPIQLDGSVRSLSSSHRVARESEVFQLEFHGEPGDVALLFSGFEQQQAFLPKFRGTLLLGNFNVFAPVLVLSPTGQFTLNVPVPELGLGVESINLYTQAFFVDTTAGNAKFLGSGAAIVLLDDSF